MKCGEEFDFDVGRIVFAMTTPNMRPKFEKEIKCKKCGVLSLDDVELTELGQGQLTELFLKDQKITL